MGKVSAELFQGLIYRASKYPSGMTIYAGKSIDGQDIGISFTDTGGYTYGEPLDDIIYGVGTTFRTYREGGLIVCVGTSYQNRIEVIKIKLVDGAREGAPIGDYEILSF